MSASNSPSAFRSCSSGPSPSSSLGWKKEGPSPPRPGPMLAPPPPGMTWWRVLLPFLVFFGMVAAYPHLALRHADLRPVAGVRRRGGRGAGPQPQEDRLPDAGPRHGQAAPAPPRDHGRRRHAPADHDRDRRPRPDVLRRHLASRSSSCSSSCRSSSPSPKAS